MPFPWLLAQDLPLNPAEIAENLAKAESVQEVLAVVVGVLLLSLAALVVYHVKRERHHEKETKAENLASNTREDSLRLHYEKRLDAERLENKKTMDDFNATLKGYAEGE